MFSSRCCAPGSRSATTLGRQAKCLPDAAYQLTLVASDCLCSMVRARGQEGLTGRGLSVSKARDTHHSVVRQHLNCTNSTIPRKFGGRISTALAQGLLSRIYRLREGLDSPPLPLLVRSWSLFLTDCRVIANISAFAFRSFGSAGVHRDNARSAWVNSPPEASKQAQKPENPATAPWTKSHRLHPGGLRRDRAP